MIPEQISDDTGTRMVKKFKGTCIKWAEENPDCLKLNTVLNGDEDMEVFLFPSYCSLSNLEPSISLKFQ